MCPLSRLAWSVTCLALLSSTVRATEPQEITLWPAGLPAGARLLAAAEVAKLKAAPVDPERINLVESPTLSIYRPLPEKANGCAVVICPGGAYGRLAWVKEGVEVAEWFNTQGITAGVLKYRVPRRDPEQPHHEPLQDAQRAVRWMRANAQQLNIDTQRVGLLGFSAGGHLTVMAGVHGAQATYPARDAIDQQSCRPDFLCPIYAAYLGENYNDRDQIELGSQIQISSTMPPTFLAVTADDAYRGVLAASLFIALKRAKVTAELHIYSQGGHGYGIRPGDHPVATWHHRLADWIADLGLDRKAP